MKKLWIIFRNRWKAKTPLIFSRIIKFSVSVSTVAVAIQAALTTSGVDAPAWWTAVAPYLIGAGAGAGVVAKLTQQYDHDNKPIIENKD